MANMTDLIAWVEEGFLRESDAIAIFPGFATTWEALKGPARVSTNYKILWDAFAERESDATKGSGGETRNAQSALSHGRQCMRYLEEHFPSISQLTVADVEAYKERIELEFAEWTVRTRMTKLRMILDQAVRLNMIEMNPAREVPLRQPKREKTYQVLDPEEASWLLRTSLEYRHLISGSLPTAIRLGLYCGLREIEMTHCSWEWFDFKRAVLVIQRTEIPSPVGDDAPARIWLPKDREAREIPMAVELMTYLQEERRRQGEEGILNPFVLPAGKNQTTAGFKLSREDVEEVRSLLAEGVAINRVAKQFKVSWNMINKINKGISWSSDGKSPYLGRPLDQSAPHKALFKMLKAEGKTHQEGSQEVAQYSMHSLRHTFATMCLRPVDRGGRGLDIRTVQEYLGHSDIRRTEMYTRAIKAEERTTTGMYGG